MPHKWRFFTIGVSQSGSAAIMRTRWVQSASVICVFRAPFGRGLSLYYIRNRTQKQRFLAEGTFLQKSQFGLLSAAGEIFSVASCPTIVLHSRRLTKRDSLRPVSRKERLFTTEVPQREMHHYRGLTVRDSLLQRSHKERSFTIEVSQREIHQYRGLTMRDSLLQRSQRERDSSLQRSHNERFFTIEVSQREILYY